ncbi:tyrosinase [Microdochium nivale]|nr:tyrosinase [Microdochium nivale]
MLPITALRLCAISAVLPLLAAGLPGNNNNNNNNDDDDNPGSEVEAPVPHDGESTWPSDSAAGYGQEAWRTRQPRHCTHDTAIVRREWHDMPRADRLSFIAAARCLKAKPSAYPRGQVPAAVSRYDDFTAVHINGSFAIHLSGIFLSWHRHFLHVFERELHCCGYPRHLGMPYWDWTRTSTDILGAGIFGGGGDLAASLGGNGVWDPDAAPIALGSNGFLPRGTGGGCVTTGPFANETVRFGPFPGSVLGRGYLPADWTLPNERCATRDLNPSVSRTSLAPAVVEQLLAARNISEVQRLLTPPDFGLDFLGLHRAGHCALGQPMADFFASPQDIVFHLHHAQIDRLWAAWQAMDPVARRYAYNGTSTVFNPVGVTPEVDNATLMDFGILASPVTLGAVADPMVGMYCYRYE